MFEGELVRASIWNIEKKEGQNNLTGMRCMDGQQMELDQLSVYVTIYREIGSLIIQLCVITFVYCEALQNFKNPRLKPLIRKEF